jgi:hypothetical protein
MSHEMIRAMMIALMVRPAPMIAALVMSIITRPP